MLTLEKVLCLQTGLQHQSLDFRQGQAGLLWRAATALSQHRGNVCLWLQAFIHGPLSHASTAETRRLQETIAELLAPMLDIITAMPTVQVDFVIASSACPEPDSHSLCQGKSEGPKLADLCCHGIFRFSLSAALCFTFLWILVLIVRIQHGVCYDACAIDVA